MTFAMRVRAPLVWPVMASPVAGHLGFELAFHVENSLATLFSDDFESLAKFAFEELGVGDGLAVGSARLGDELKSGRRREVTQGEITRPFRPTTLVHPEVRFPDRVPGLI